MRLNRLAIVALLLLLTSQLHAATGQMAKLNKVIDGTTISVNLQNKETTVRLYGIATPNPNDKQPVLRQLGEQATAFLNEYLKNGWVYLEYPGGQMKADDKGVVDAYVFRGSDAKFVNEILIAEGFGITNRKISGIYAGSFADTENKARMQQKGLWSDFKDGDGKRMGSDAGKYTYLGEAAAGRGSTNSYVYFWIISFW